MKILFISRWFPYPPINGAKIRVYNLLRQLAKHHEITLLSFSQTIPPAEIPAYIPELEKYCASVKFVPARAFNPNSFAAYLGFLSLYPRSIKQTYSHEMEKLINETLKIQKFDIMIASEVNAPTIVSLLAARTSGIPKIIDALEVALVRDAYYGENKLIPRLRHGLTWFKLRWFTQSVLQQADACTVPSVQEQGYIQKFIPKDYPIEIIPHCLDIDAYQPVYGLPKQSSMVFTGSFTYHPNLDGVRYFLGEIYSRIRTQVPEAELKIIGNTTGIGLDQLPAQAGVTLMGLIPDVREDVARSWLSIAPLRLGSGTRLKIVESMALGTPVISTSKGAEGLDVTHGKNILIADTPQEFSEAVVAVLNSPDLRQSLSLGGLQLVAEKYSLDVLSQRFEALMDYVVHQKR